MKQTNSEIPTWMARRDALRFEQKETKVTKNQNGYAPIWTPASVRFICFRRLKIEATLRAV